MYYIYIYISIEHDFPQVMAVLSHTHILSRGQNYTQKTTALLLTFQIFFFKRMHNTFHLVTFIQSLYVLNVTLFTN